MSEAILQFPPITQSNVNRANPRLALVQRLCDSTLRLLQNANWLPRLNTEEILFHA